jgi:hypothetical protein
MLSRSCTCEFENSLERTSSGSLSSWIKSGLPPAREMCRALSMRGLEHI